MVERTFCVGVGAFQATDYFSHALFCFGRHLVFRNFAVGKVNIGRVRSSLLLATCAILASLVRPTPGPAPARQTHTANQPPSRHTGSPRSKLLSIRTLNRFASLGLYQRTWDHRTRSRKRRIGPSLLPPSRPKLQQSTTGRKDFRQIRSRQPGNNCR